jgi:hypothetical protein
MIPVNSLPGFGLAFDLPGQMIPVRFRGQSGLETFALDGL